MNYKEQLLSDLTLTSDFTLSNEVLAYNQYDSREFDKLEKYKKLLILSWGLITELSIYFLCIFLVLHYVKYIDIKSALVIVLLTLLTSTLYANLIPHYWTEQGKEKLMSNDWLQILSLLSS